MNRRIARVLLGAALAGATLVAAVTPAGSSPAAPAGRYLVRLQPGNDPAAFAREQARRDGARTLHVYRAAVRGFAAEMTPGVAARLARDPRVAVVEPDQRVHVAAQTVPTGIVRVSGSPAGASAVPNLAIDGVDDVRVNADVAIIDSGIAAHPDLNLYRSVDCVAKACTAGGTDGYGHGTHVAGTVGALDNGVGVVGVAPGVRLWAVRVLGNDGWGSFSDIVAGIDYVAQNAASIEVANMSLGCDGCTSSTMDTAIANLVAKGVPVVVAAGNEGKDASTFTPANHPDVITVSALSDEDGVPGGLGGDMWCDPSETDDTLASWSNHGPLVELTAPGDCIASTVPGGYADGWSGTSMAAPHVTGAVALLLANQAKPTTKAGADAVRSTLIADGRTDWTDDVDGVAEPRVDVSGSAYHVVAPPPNSAPAGSITSASCTKAQCTFRAAGTDPDGDPLSFAWDFGDGSTGTGTPVTHTFGGAATRTFTVALTVSDGRGGTARDSASVRCTGKGGRRTCSVTL